MELTAAATPFVYVPLEHHFEQNFHVRHRLDRYGQDPRCPTPMTRTRTGSPRRLPDGWICPANSGRWRPRGQAGGGDARGVVVA